MILTNPLNQGFVAMRKLALVFVAVFIYVSSLQAQDQRLELPTYHLTVDSADLSALYQSPRSNARYPAQFSFAGEVLECEVRFRGETARFYPKKSWKVWFEDSSNPVGVRELNLNAEYSDRSLMRNALAMRLYQFIGHPAPNTEHISLMVNDDFMGVFVQVEEPDQELLRRYDYELGSLYKSENHGGSTAPLLDYDTYFWSWNKKVGGESDYIDGQRLFNQLLYLTYEDFAERISLLVDVENVLQYFAVAYAISSLDAVTKNTLLYFDPSGHLQQILPWDHDASFGNYWTGEYRPYFETVSEHPHLNHNLLFQRLMEYDAWRESFWSKVSFVIEHGFAAVEAEIDSTYELIKSDVYLDRAKIGTNAEFDDAISRLKGFLAARRSFLTDFPFVEKKKNLLADLYCSDPFPSPDADDRGVVFRATSRSPQAVVVEYITDLSSYETWGEEITVKELALFDDGRHDDLQAGDLVYGNRLVLPKNYTGLVPYSFRAGGYSYPSNGLFYINYRAMKTFALNVNHAGIEEYRHLQIGDVQRIRDEYFIEIINAGELNLNLSYCSFEAGEYFNRFMFPPGTNIEAGSSLILSSNRDAAGDLFPDSPVFGNLFFAISLGDTMKLLTPTLTVMTARVNETYSAVDLPIPSIVINEINYHSADDLDTGDWVELYNPNDASVDLSGWNFQDDDDDHSFVLPGGTLIEPRGFLVLCRDGAALESLLGVSCVGDFDFGLRNSGELVRLFDSDGLLVDSFTYLDESPWPEEADGDGPTLELLHYSLDNADPMHWRASIPMGGTPGRANSVLASPTAIASETDGGTPRSFNLFQNYPNPFNSETHIAFHLPRTEHLSLEIFNLTGQLVATLMEGVYRAGRHRIAWDGRDDRGESVGSGIFFYRLTTETSQSTRTMVLVK